MNETNTQQHVLEQCLTLKSQLEAIESQIAITQDTEILATLIDDRDQLVSKFNEEKIRLRVVSGLPVPKDACSNEYDRMHNDLVLANKLLVEKLNEAKQKNDVLTTELDSERLRNTHMQEGMIALLTGRAYYKLPGSVVAAFHERIAAHRQEVTDIKLDRDRSLAGVLELLRCGETDYELSTDIWDAIGEKNRVVENLEARFRRLQKNHDDVLVHIGRGLSGHTYSIDGIPEGIQRAIDYKKSMLADYDRVRTTLDNVTKERDEARDECIELKQICERIAPQSQEERFEIKCTIADMERRIDHVCKERNDVQVKLDNVSRERDDARVELDELKQKLDDMNRYQRKYGDVLSELDALKHHCEHLTHSFSEAYARQQSKINAAIQERDEARVKLDNMERKVLDREQAYDNLHAGVIDMLWNDRANDVPHDISYAIDDFHRTIRDLRSMLKAANQRCDTLADERDQARAALESAETKCKHVMSRCDAVESRMHEYAKMASDHEATLCTRNEIVQKLTEDLRNSSNQLIALAHRCENAEEQLTATTRERDGVIADIATLTERLSELEKTVYVYADRVASAHQDNTLLRDATNRITTRAEALDRQNTYLRECVDKAIKWMKSHPYADK
jgi:archaellum component FlaC